jgi:hypothetical protein
VPRQTTTISDKGDARKEEASCKLWWVPWLYYEDNGAVNTEWASAGGLDPFYVKNEFAMMEDWRALIYRWHKMGPEISCPFLNATGLPGHTMVDAKPVLFVCVFNAIYLPSQSAIVSREYSRVARNQLCDLQPPCSEN